MKKNFSPHFFTGIVFSAILFASCENIFSGAEKRAEIEAAVKFANAPTFGLKIYSESSETIPSGNQVKKVGEKFSLICKPFNDYEFIKWQAFHQDESGNWLAYSDEEFSELFDVENKFERETIFALKKDVSGLMIQPKCVQRPAIISTFPYYEKSGLLRDSRISIMFDQNMDEGSIYYTVEELKADFKNLGLLLEDLDIHYYMKDIDLTDEEKVTAEKLNESGSDNQLYILYDGAEPESIENITLENKVYGYIFPSDNGDEKIYTTVYKNIQIANRNKENMLSHYMAPYFDRPDILIVPSEPGSLMPPPSSNVLTTISKGFFSNYSEEGFEKAISIAGNKKFNYYLNSQIDNTNPDVEFTLTDSSGRNLKGEAFSGSLTYSSIQNYSRLIDKKIKLYLKATDSESGLFDYFKISLRKYSTSKYENNLAVLGYEQKTISLNFTDAIDSYKYFRTEDSSDPDSTEPVTLDLEELFPTIINGQGLYGLTITVTDVNGNDYNNQPSTGGLVPNFSNKLQRYVIIDNEAPDLTKDDIQLDNSQPGKITVKFRPSADFQKADIQYTLNGQNYTTVTLNRSSSFPSTESKTVTLDKGKQYRFKITLYDCFDADTEDFDTNYSDNYSKTIDFGYQWSRPDYTRMTSITSTNTSITVNWQFPSHFASNSSNEGTLIFYGPNYSLSSAAYVDFWCPCHSTTYHKIEPLTPGTPYYVFLVSYTGSKPSNSSVINGTSQNTYYDNTYSSQYIYTKPTQVTNLTATINNKTNVYLSWTKPSSGNVDGYAIYKKDLTAGDSSWSLSSTINNKNTTSAPVTNLARGHKYSFCVRSYVKNMIEDDGTRVESDDTTATATTKLLAPTITSVSSTSSKLTVSWNNPSGEWDGVSILYSTTDNIQNASEGDYWYKQHNVSSCPIPRSSTLSGGTTYYVWVVSWVWGVDGSKPTVTQIKQDPNTVCASYSVKATTRPSVTIPLTLDANGTLSWSWPSGNYTHIRIYYKKPVDSSFSTTPNTFDKSSGITSQSFYINQTGYYYFRAYAAKYVDYEWIESDTYTEQSRWFSR